MADLPLVRDRDGDLYPDTTDTPAHHWRCDGATGHTMTADPLERLPIACPVCRPHLAVRHQRDGRRPVVSLGR